MKHTTNLLAVAALLLCAMCSVSCNKDNPREEPYASVDFKLKISEVRQSKTFEWEVVANTISIDPAEQELQELWITAYNTVTVSALPLTQGFEGANFSSSDPRRVKVVKIDAQSCTLEYTGDTDEQTPVTITAKAGDYTHSFKVFSKEVIPLKGVEFWHDLELDGHEQLDIAPATGANENGDFFDFKGIYPQGERNSKDWGPIHVRIGKLVPENASFRYVVKTKFDEMTSNEMLMRDFIRNGTDRCDFSEFQGKETDMNVARRSRSQRNYILFYFAVNSKEPVNKENRVSGFYYDWR